ncbi:MAG TPA: DNA polymerase I [Verrucomicrobiae bacterium]|nr:DNA polymerase I [Verrucomicrobiae bacterium]
MAPPPRPGRPPRLLLIDGHALAFRAYYALPALSNSRGDLINAVYGFTSMLLLSLAQGFEHAVAAFDPPGPTFRDQLLATYKAQRAPTPDEFHRQIPLCERVLGALHIPVVVVAGFEADDVIGTLSRQAEAQGCDTVILTADLDLVQLVTDRTIVQASRRGVSDPLVYDLQRVRERFGFEPIHLIDFKALRGDPSDNIPGVPGIGEKTAAALVQRHGDVETILAAAASMKVGRVRSGLESHVDQVRLGRELVTIVRDVPGVVLDLDRCRLADMDPGTARAVLRDLEMPSLARRLPGGDLPSAGADPSAAALGRPEPVPPASSVGAEGVPSDGTDVSLASLDCDPEVVADPEQLARMLQAVRRAGAAALRTVVEGSPRRGRITGVAVATDPRTAWFCALDPAVGPDGRHLAGGSLDPLRRLVADPAVALAGYNLKPDWLAWNQRGTELGGLDFDCVLASYLADSKSRTPKLDVLARDHARLSIPDDRAGAHLGDSDPGALARRHAILAATVWAVRPSLERALAAVDGTRMLHDLEIPLVPILGAMEALGVRVDPGPLRELGRELTQQIGQLEAAIHEAAGRRFLIGSPQQLATVLYDELHLASSRRTKTGRSTDAAALEQLRTEHPIVARVLEWRQLTKLQNTYVDQLPELVDPVDGRVHTSFNQAVAATGRLSSSDPNLQNIPVRTEAGRRIRAAFLPAEPGWQLLSADYSQVELRVLAHLSQDPGLLAAFARGADVHAETAASVFGVSPDAVTPEQRRMAKVVNFGILYGLSTFGLSRDLQIASAAAEAFIQRYFETFAGVRAYLARIRVEAHEQGYVTTLLGRRRILPDLRAGSRPLREASERMAVNMPIQGSAADLMKVGMLRCQAALGPSGLRARLLLQVHDELVFEAPADELPALAELAREAMAGAAELSVPLVVDCKSGPNWADLTALPAGPGRAHA